MPNNIERIKALHHAILNSAEYSIISTDLSGLILTFNKAAENMLGYAADEMVGTATPAVFHDLNEVVERASLFSQELGIDVQPGFDVFVIKARLGLPNEYEWTYVHKDGSRFPVQLSVTVLKDEAGTMLGYLGIAKNIYAQKQAQAQLLAAQSSAHEAAIRYRAILDTAVDGIVTIDEHGIVESVNKAVETLFGYTPDEIISQNVKMLMPSPYREQHDQYLLNYCQTGEAKIIGIGREVLGQHKDGSVFPLELSVSEVFLEDKRLFTGILRDIRQRKKFETDLKNSEAQIKQMMEAIPIGIFVMDATTMQPYYANRTAQKLLGKGIMKAEMHQLSELYQVYRAGTNELYPTEELPVIRALSGEDVMLNDMEVHQPDRVVPIQVWACPIYNVQKQITSAVAAFIDITERQEAERRLRDAKEIAEQATQAKSQFLANMSHELRTPLNAIIGYSEMLQEDAQDQEMTELVDDLQKIRSAGKKLLYLINDILDLSKIEAGMMEIYLEELHISDLFQDVAQTVTPLVAKNNNQLRIECPENAGTIYSDLTKIRQIIFNLLSNAAKFTQNGIITLGFDRQKSDNGEKVAFSISDTGIGIATDQIHKLFKSFSQVDASTTRHYGGTGLGLALSQQFAHMLGGEITVESALNQGSTFTLSLTTICALPASVLTSDTPQASSKMIESHQHSVLVIDDDPLVHNLMKKILTRQGFVMVSAFSGKEGIQLARQLKPDLITLDVMMPETDGWHVLQHLKKQADLSGIPVVLLSLAGNQELGFTLGAVEYLSKPLDAKQFVAALRQYLPHTGQPNVLVVEDDKTTREMIHRILHKEGYAVTEAANGQDALTILDYLRPDLIITDLMMPTMSGFELVEHLQENEQWSSIPVIVTTAKDLSWLERNRLNGFIQVVMRKGNYSQTEFLEKIRQWLGEKPIQKE